MKKIFIVAGLLISSAAISNPVSITPKSVWQDIKNNSGSNSKIATNLSAKQYDNQAHKSILSRILTLNEQALKEILINAPSSQTKGLQLAQKSSYQKLSHKEQVEIDLPLPDGKFIRVRVIDSPILSKEIAEQHPEIKTWRVIGIDNAAISGRLDFTSKGFHGMLNMPDGDTVFIDPDLDVNKNSTGIYHSLSKHDNAWRFNQNFNCKVHNEHSLLDDVSSKKLLGKNLAQKAARDLITYRLVVAGTGEYTESQGGTSSAAFSSIVTTINRVNEVYQRDLSINFKLVSGDSFVYTNPNSDPYSNNDAVAMVSQNINNINSTLGSENYDIAHVFAKGKIGGLSYVGAACLDNYKAGGVTGTPDPAGEIFSIEFVAHELGHQLGATHSFNSDQGGCGYGNRTPETAVEPGSGSTIMSYVGLCDTDNIQRDSDALFHSVSIGQILTYTRQRAGSTCGSKKPSNNQNPEANAGSNSIIPINTPFFLDGSSTKGQTFSWDQIDAGRVSRIDIDKQDNAIIRVMPLSTIEDRYIPRLSNLFAGTRMKGEILPQTIRDLNFSFVVRDGNGGIDQDTKQIEVTDISGIFKVTSQANAQTYHQKQSIRVDWDVAGTNNSPIYCRKVDIQLLRESGVKNMLLANAENNGSAQFIIPASTPNMKNARIMVACHSQPFFQISNGAITIQGNAVAAAPEKPKETIKEASSDGGGSIGFFFLSFILLTIRKTIKNI